MQTDALLQEVRERVQNLVAGRYGESEKDPYRADTGGHFLYEFNPRDIGLVSTDEVDDVKDASVEQLTEQLDKRLGGNELQRRLEQELQFRSSNPIMRRDLICDMYGLPHTASIETILKEVEKSL